MAKKNELLMQAKDLSLEVTAKNTIAQITEAIEGAAKKPAPKKAVKATAKEVKAEEKPTETKEDNAEKVTKAGKHSAKALREEEEEAERLEKKAKREAGEVVDEEAVIKRGPVPVTRPKSERRSKAYKTAYDKVGREALELKPALDAIVSTMTTKFDSTVELHIRLGVDPKQAEQNIRDSIVLPNGTGKTVRVAVFAPIDMHEDAKKAGADIVKDDSLLEDLKKDKIDFDLLISTPQFMAKLGQFARSLGPKGLMPSPKAGTVTTDVVKAVKEAKAGRIEYRVDPQGIIHVGFGKVSFGSDKLVANAEAVIESVRANKPATIKGNYVIAMHLTTTMGPSVKLKT